MNIHKLLLSTLASVAMTMGAVSTASAATEPGSATAAVVTAITVAETRAMNFGAFTPGAGGPVVLANTAGATPDVSGGAVTMLGSGAAASGEFTITNATPGTVVTISISSAVTQLSNGVQTMDFTPNTAPSVGSPYTIVTQTADTFYVGGTLTVGATQAEGVYTNASAYTVTVDYQ